MSGINNTLMHCAQDDLPFGGVGPGGTAAYHGIEGFRRMSHAEGIYVQGRWNAATSCARRSATWRTLLLSTLR